MLEISWLESAESTHLLLVNAIRSQRVSPPMAICARRQDSGVGSRGNRWEGGEGNLFLSFCLSGSALPKDLPRQSMSIYFSWLLKETLADFGSKVWLKWPNDFYVGRKKAGGTITAVLREDIVVCSVGLNLRSAPEKFATIDVEVDKNELLEAYFLKLKEENFWKDIFIKYKVEFLLSTGYEYFDQATQKKRSLKEAVLQNDGSILIDNRRVYSLR